MAMHADHLGPQGVLCLQFAGYLGVLIVARARRMLSNPSSIWCFIPGIFFVSKLFSVSKVYM
ncbi:hypothetical protein R3P38DRAFT_2893515 [Favolaschia claudopus]|uniref:Uncharacterized protein n=1 Tax=Favolaschia claudopus TaxID=2862362 RepID=A0AAW0CTD9_9AGAR